MTPSELLDQFNDRSNVRKQRSLRLIDDICREQKERGSLDFTVATVGKLSEQRGGPSCQAIRNKSGADYRALIAAWSEYAGCPARKTVASSTPRREEAMLKRIDDPVVRAEVGFLLAENRKLKGQIRLLQQAVQHPIVIDQRHGTKPTPEGDVLLATDLSELERDALTHATTETCLAENGWVADRRGAVVDSISGRKIFKNGFMTALRKILMKQSR